MQNTPTFVEVFTRAVVCWDRSVSRDLVPQCFICQTWSWNRSRVVRSVYHHFGHEVVIIDGVGPEFPVDLLPCYDGNGCICTTVGRSR